MTPLQNATSLVPSASEYILDSFEPRDRIAMLVLNRDFGETIQRLTSPQKAASPEFQAWLRYKNANGSDIYLGMNPLRQDAATRTKEEIETIRHVYLDLDQCGPQTELCADEFSRKIPGRLERGRDEPGRSRKFIARHGPRIRRRSRRHRCHPCFAASRFRQQEIPN